MGSRYTGDFVKAGTKVSSKYVGNGNKASKGQGKAGGGDKLTKGDHYDKPKKGC